MPQEKKLITPKFLTADLATTAMIHVTQSLNRHAAIPDKVGNLLKQQMYHIVVLGPAMEDAREEDYPSWPNYPLQAALIAEFSVGDRKIWPYPFADIARCKALQLWGDRNDDRTDIIPHLLFSGDSPFWGGVKRHGIVVACSGVQSYFDKMISGMVADMIAGLAYHAWKTSEDKKATGGDACYLA